MVCKSFALSRIRLRFRGRTWAFALRAVFNVNVRQWAVNERQWFLCGQWCAMSVNGLARSVAVEMVVNGVLRTLWVIKSSKLF